MKMRSMRCKTNGVDVDDRRRVDIVEALRGFDTLECTRKAQCRDAPASMDRSARRAGAYRSRAASCTIFLTGESRYCRTVRVPNLISPVTCMPGDMRYRAPSACRYGVLSEITVR